jgi:NAD(P)H-hydrate repair Nnr-like enzyme with NAD(P)H-hydrate dehydratase domain
MEDTKWLKQTDEPLFPDVLWSRPENRRYAGKLMIAGGHAQSFSAPSRAFAAASKAGAGTVRVLLPDSLQKTVGGGFAEAEFANSTPIGSFGGKAFALFMDLAGWSDWVLLAGDFGKNSETAVLLGNFIDKHTGGLTITGDALDYFMNNPEVILDRSNTIITATFSQLQKLALPFTALKQTADLAQVVSALNGWTSKNGLEIITEHSNQIIVSRGGRASTTRGGFDPDIAAYASVWRLQQPERPFEALTTAIYCLYSSREP